MNNIPYEHWKESIQSLDERRNIVSPGNLESTLQFCVEHFLSIGHASIADHGYFAVALSGGTTPKAIYQELAMEPFRGRLEWNKVLLFWSDERCVPPYSPESNYRMAMDAAFSKLGLPAENIFRMQADGDPEEGALLYDQLIRTKIPSQSFDLVMLGVGEDGHTASLFPKTHGLHAESRVAIANYIPQKNAWRITLSFSCINSSKNIAVYALGKEKADIVNKVLNGPYQPDDLPAQRIGSETNKALWITCTT